MSERKLVLPDSKQRSSTTAQGSDTPCFVLKVERRLV